MKFCAGVDLVVHSQYTVSTWVVASADEVLNELLSEASLEPSQAKDGQPLSPEEASSPFAQVAVQQADRPGPAGHRLFLTGLGVS